MEKSDYGMDMQVKKIYSGKVRDIFELQDGNILMVATDRISAFDYILPTPIPEKGIILTQMSIFWFEYLKKIIDNHIVEKDFDKFPETIRKNPFLRNRSIIVKKAERIPVECVVRGYLAGSGWKEYKETGMVCGISLPGNLKEGSRIPEPIFTPATKEDIGKHDMNISFSETEKIVGKERAAILREKSVLLYKEASAYALNKGIIIADAKFEFGIYDKKLILIDELFTPDSSRFWEVQKYREGIPQESLDKQYIRNYLLSTDWDRNSLPPSLPEEVVQKTIEKYKNIYQLITGKSI
ncbi:MAG TPA: phosphoribosylaminoimidazolesuccinocarboxamide synthase [bacterium]|nr:phosphoribosylaminoimidazolesuccinocarboxamide synthase [bacterium]